jgi:hypothetical protein
MWIGFGCLRVNPGEMSHLLANILCRFVTVLKAIGSLSCTSLLYLVFICNKGKGKKY